MSSIRAVWFDVGEVLINETREYLNGNDLYPDVLPCLHALKDAGYFVSIAGNQTTRAGPARAQPPLRRPRHLRTLHRRPHD